MPAKRTAKKEAKLMVDIPAPDFRWLEVEVEGDSPLVVHKFSEKARRTILDKQMKKAKPGREAKDPKACYEGAMYKLAPRKGKKDRYGFPVVGFKSAMSAAGFRYLGLKDRVSVQGALFIEGEETKDGTMAEIIGTPEMREDMVRLSTGVADIRFRPAFFPWRAKLRIKYNAGFISDVQIVHLLDTAGFSVGVGEWRPEKKGQWGTFHVVK